MPLVGFEQETNGFQLYAIANLDQTSLQGVAMLWHYLKVIYTPSCEETMLNVVKYIRTRLLRAMLSEYFNRYHGLCSRTMLYDFLDKGSNVLEISPEDILRDTFEKYGPDLSGLLPLFQVHNDFFEAGVLSFTNSPNGEVIGLHSIVMLGIRNEGSSRIFLLQNWCREKQFVEVSEDYLSRMECVVCFIGTPQTFEGDSCILRRHVRR